MDNQKVLLLIVGVLVAGLLIGNIFTGQAVRKKLLIGDPSPSVCADLDNDTYSGSYGCGTSKDCNDNNPNVYPGAIEVCGNGIDDDCSNGDIGLCKTAVYIQTDKGSYYENEGVLLK